MRTLQLCHYTSLETLRLILDQISNDKLILHASNIFSMNDPEEFRFGYDSCIKLLQEIEHELGVAENKRVSLIGKNATGFQEELFNQLYSNLDGPFVTSFCQDNDSLPLWNMYGDNGNGINLDFKRQVIRFNDKRPALSEVDVIPNVEDVSYDKFVDNEDFYKEQIKKYYRQYLNNYQKKISATQISTSLQVFCLTLRVIAPLIKSSAYAFEQESRIVINGNKNSTIKFRTRRNRLVPYIEVDIPLEYLDTITIGPCADFVTVSRGIRQMLMMKGISDKAVNIVRSTIAYRND